MYTYIYIYTYVYVYIYIYILCNMYVLAIHDVWVPGGSIQTETRVILAIRQTFLEVFGF